MMPDSLSQATLQRPTQAVILAGGRGTRLRPYTDTRPKPMIEIHGKPFLEYMVEMLRDQGFERILMLLGYLPKVIQNHFGDGRRWGVRIEYSITDPDDLTAHRVKVAREHLDPCFLLLYCDNYWPMRMDRMWEHFVAARVPAMITVYSNKDKYSKDSVIVGEDGYVRVHDRSRTTPGLQGIEISYALINKSVLELLPEEDALFEEALYPQLVKRGQLAAYVTDHRYYSVGSLERLPITEAFFARKPAIILDRDGVLNKRPPRAEYVRGWEGFEWLPGAKEALRLLKEAGYRVIIVSNQAGIAREAMTEADLKTIHERMKAEVIASGGQIDAIYYCPHHWDEGCECRKPKPGMLFQAQRDWHLDLSRTPFIGDDERDAQAAFEAGCPSALVSEQVSLLDVTRKMLNGGLGK
ncbi:MAG TPA: HAD-IIIA family hydrolase [Pyrinomonadaceae bacterium]|nr:HAD-IIIA family hydrolase [Pyrinomonadaceae bacterium]